MEFDLLKGIIAEVLDIDEEQITPETEFIKDLSADSIDLFQIIMALEEELDVEVDTSKVEDVVTVQDALDLIQDTIG